MLWDLSLIDRSVRGCTSTLVVLLCLSGHSGAAAQTAGPATSNASGKPAGEKRPAGADEEPTRELSLPDVMRKVFLAYGSRDLLNRQESNCVLHGQARLLSGQPPV